MVVVTLWILLFVISYLVIYFAADLFLENLKFICEIYKLSPFIIGMLVLGIDLEESIASIFAAINGLPYISIGNVLGNSIIAMTLPFSIPILIHTLKFKSISRFYFILLYVLMIIAVIGFIFDDFLFISGLLALLGYVGYFFRNLKRYRKEKELDMEPQGDRGEIPEERPENLLEISKFKIIFLSIISLVLIFIGGEFLVISADNLINLLKIPESFFGFIIIGFVTNVEEMTLVIKSIKKKSVDIGFGGMIGKLIWNLTITFGISGIIIRNITFNWILVWNWLLLLGIIFYFNYVSKRGELQKKNGILLLVIFGVFILINSITI